jgi:hypothetical protein
MASTTTVPREQRPSTTFDWRSHLAIHPAADAYPKVPHDRLVEIGESIRRSGLEFPILINAKGDPGNPEAFELFDGVTRLNSMVAAGIKFEFERFRFARGSSSHGHHSLRLVIHDVPTNPDLLGTTKIFHNLSDAEIADKIEIANLHRRHLEPEQYHARIEASHARIETALKRDPEKSDRQLGEELGHDHKTVGAIRRKMEDVGSLPHVPKRTDTKGRQQPAKKAEPVSSPGFDAACELAKRLGREVVQLKSRSFRLTSPDDGPGICFPSLKRLNEALKDVESEAGAKAALAGDPGAEDAEASAGERKAAYANDEKSNGASADALAKFKDAVATLFPLLTDDDHKTARRFVLSDDWRRGAVS